jgi:hypothetical protein
VPGKPKRHWFEREEHLKRTAALYLQGKTQADIGRELGVSRGQIWYDLKEIRARWQEQCIRDYDKIAAQELERIDLLESEAWAAWERSKLPRETSITATEREAVGVGLESIETKHKAQLRKEGQCGDPRFLERIAWCISERAKILGGYAPTKHQHGGDPDGTPIETTHTVNVWQHATVEELEEQKALRQRLAARAGGVPLNGSSNGHVQRN